MPIQHLIERDKYLTIEAMLCLSPKAILFKPPAEVLRDMGGDPRSQKDL